MNSSNQLRAFQHSAAVYLYPDDTAKKITDFAGLPKGWLYGRGVAPSAAMIQSAINWNMFMRLSRFYVTDAFPGENGEVCITAYHSTHFIEVILEITGRVSFYHEIDGELIKSLENAEAQTVAQEIIKIAGEIWNSSGLFIHATTTQRLSGLRASHSGYPQTIMAHRLLTYSVSQTPEGNSATIFASTTQTSEENHRYSGFLMNQLSPEFRPHA